MDIAIDMDDVMSQPRDNIEKEIRHLLLIGDSVDFLRGWEYFHEVHSLRHQDMFLVADAENHHLIDSGDVEISKGIDEHIKLFSRGRLNRVRDYTSYGKFLIKDSSLCYISDNEKVSTWLYKMVMSQLGNYYEREYFRKSYAWQMIGVREKIRRMRVGECLMCRSKYKFDKQRIRHYGSLYHYRKWINFLLTLHAGLSLDVCNVIFNYLNYY